MLSDNPTAASGDRAEILQMIREQLADILELDDPSKIAESASFVEDLGADSLVLIELVEGIEEELSGQGEEFRIEDEELEDLKTVRDAVDYVAQRLAG